MEINILKNLLSRFNREAFIEYIFELFRQDDTYTDKEYQRTYYLKKSEKTTIEQNYIKLNSRFSREAQGFNLILPFFYPFDLFNKIENINIELPDISRILKNYKRKVVKRESSWQFWTDGTYIIPDIKFITNYAGLDKKIYMKTIIPKLERFVENFNMDAQVMVGSCDSFIALNPKGALKAFNNFVNKYKSEISISLNPEKYIIQNHFNEKYFTEGVLKNSKNPCEPVLSFNTTKSNSIIEEFEYLLNNEVSETTLENFLKKYYKEIFGEHYNKIETQVWLKFPELDINNKDRKIDIFLRNSIERDWELFELKKTSNIIKSYRDIPVFKAELNNAIQQLKNYNRILIQDKVKRAFEKEGIEYYNPELRLVIGRNPDMPIEQWRWLKSTNQNDLKIITYDELYEGLKSRLDFHKNHNLFNISD